jgi:hypothetical protein
MAWDGAASGTHTKLPVSVLPRAKTRMVLGQAPALPLSSSDLDPESWRASRLLGSRLMPMGDAMAIEARRDAVKNFMLVDMDGLRK